MLAAVGCVKMFPKDCKDLSSEIYLKDGVTF